MKKKFLIVFMLIAAMLCCVCLPGCKGKTEKIKTMHVSVVEESKSPVVGKTHTGSKDNVAGYENGQTIYFDGKYHMLITEMFVDGNIQGQGVWSPARIGYWTSEDGDDWTRQSTIVQGNAEWHSPKENSWSPAFYWNEKANLWNVTWRGFNAVYLYKSTVPGEAGIAGPYVEEKLMFPPLEGKRVWSENVFSSFGNVFTAKDGKMYAFACEGNNQNSNPNWVAGLIYSDGGIEGNWTRYPTDTPIFNYCENPYVSQYDDMYYCTYDDIIEQKSIGIGYSEDGLNWNRYTLDLEKYVDWSASNWYVESIRTPMGLIKDSDGKYSVFFTAYDKETSYYSIGKIRLDISFTEEESRSADEIDITTKDAWTAINGRWFSEYDGLSIFKIDDDFYANALKEEIKGDFELSTTFRAVINSGSLSDARGGIFFGKKNTSDFLESSAYYVFVSGDKKVKLYEGNDLLAEADLDTRPFMYKELRVVVSGKSVKVYYDSDTPLIEENNLFYDGGYAGILAGKEHLHFESVHLKRG